MTTTAVVFQEAESYPWEDYLGFGDTLDLCCIFSVSVIALRLDNIGMKGTLVSYLASEALWRCRELDWIHQAKLIWWPKFSLLLLVFWIWKSSSSRTDTCSGFKTVLCTFSFIVIAVPSYGIFRRAQVERSRGDLPQLLSHVQIVSRRNSRIRGTSSLKRQARWHFVHLGHVSQCVRKALVQHMKQEDGKCLFIIIKIGSPIPMVIYHHWLWVRRRRWAPTMNL